MKIVCLAENTSSGYGIAAEHGLSLYIEHNGLRILFDMGQSDLFLRNAEKLGVDLSLVDFAVLSHGHYDHGGGIPHFLNMNKKAPVYISPYAFGEYYNGKDKYIGLDAALQNEPRLLQIERPTELCRGITLYPAVFKNRLFDTESFGLTERNCEVIVPDTFRHEQFMVIKENERSILFSGCSHSGIRDIVNLYRPDVFVGGFHLSKLSSSEECGKYASFLNSFDCDYYTCHCTGTDVYGYMREQMKNLEYISAGDTLVL